MATKKYNWLTRLIDKITKTDCPNNNSFIYYNHRVDLMSGTVDYVDVHISDMDYSNQKSFTFDYWTKELCFTSYDNYDQVSIMREYNELLSRKAA